MVKDVHHQLKLELTLLGQMIITVVLISGAFAIKTNGTLWSWGSQQGMEDH